MSQIKKKIKMDSNSNEYFLLLRLETTTKRTLEVYEHIMHKNW